MSYAKIFALFFVSFLCICGCTMAQNEPPATTGKTAQETVEKIENPGKVIHVLVALCDNENQGIVPVPSHLGNGDDAKRNLYWGAAFGVKTFFSKSAHWQKLAEVQTPNESIVERIVFKHRQKNVYLVADAYRGSRMKETINAFFSAVSGERRENVPVGEIELQILGSADLVAFVGHNGLMDFRLKQQPKRFDDEKRDAVILACASRAYFSEPLKITSANPLLWTTNLMAPEAYILHDALEGWVRSETDAEVRARAAAAYAKYQKISLKAARNLIVTGW